MKKNIIIFPRDNYLAGTTGGVKVYRCSDANRELLGQAKTIRFQVFGFRRTLYARVVVKMWESPVPDVPPSEVIPDGSPFYTSSAITVLRPAPVDIPGPFAANVEFTLEVDASSGSAQEEFELMIPATLILEE